MNLSFMGGSLRSESQEHASRTRPRAGDVLRGSADEARFRSSRGTMRGPLLPIVNSDEAARRRSHADLGGAFTPLYQRLVELGVAGRIVGKIGPRGCSADFAVDEPGAFLRDLETSGHFCSDRPVGRMLHRGTISLRELRKARGPACGCRDQRPGAGPPRHILSVRRGRPRPRVPVFASARRGSCRDEAFDGPVSLPLLVTGSTAHRCCFPCAGPSSTILRVDSKQRSPPQRGWPRIPSRPGSPSM